MLRVTVSRMPPVCALVDLAIANCDWEDFARAIDEATGVYHG